MLGIQFVKAVKSVLPNVKLMITGGVSPGKESLTAWLQAGANAVGMGSQLFRKEWLEEGNFEAIEETVEKCFGFLG